MAKDGNRQQQQQNRGGDLPPYLSYDPAILAELRASGRGLDDLLLDLKRERNITRKDSRTERGDIRTEERRGKRDFASQLRRGLQDVSFQRQDTKLGLERGEEDFATQIANLARNYERLGTGQGQAINAAGGVATSGAARLAATRRSENMTLERQPLETGLERLQQDTGTQLGRLGVAAGQMRQDTAIGRRRLRQDVSHDLDLNALDRQRAMRDIRLRRQRGIREGEFAETDLTSSAIFDARNRRRFG